MACDHRFFYVLKRPQSELGFNTHFSIQCHIVPVTVYEAVRKENELIP